MNFPLLQLMQQLHVHIALICCLLSLKANLFLFLTRVREVPAEFQNIPFQAMECFLTGLKPLALVTAYFDLTTAKQ